MSQFISINNRQEINNLLISLNPATKPLWGKMKPQEMVEHLVDAVEYTNGKMETVSTRPAADADRDRKAMVVSTSKMQRNVILEELPKDYRYADLQTAIAQLMQELNDFDDYFKTPGIRSVHFWFGPLNHEEWLIWHGKHFTHHLEQFGLIPE